MKPTQRALLVIDVQNEYFDGKLRITHPPVTQSLPNILLAMDTANAHGMPIAVVQHSAGSGAPIFADGSHGWALHADVAKRHFSHRVEKQKASAFTGTGLASWLQAHDVSTLSIVGYMTHNCNAATIFEASHAGFEVEFLHDAAGSLPYANDAGTASAEEIHRVMSVVFHSNFAAVLSTQQWLQALQSGSKPSKDNVFSSNQRALG